MKITILFDDVSSYEVSFSTPSTLDVAVKAYLIDRFTGVLSNDIILQFLGDI